MSKPFTLEHTDREWVQWLDYLQDIVPNLTDRGTPKLPARSQWAAGTTLQTSKATTFIG